MNNTIMKLQELLDIYLAYLKDKGFLVFIDEWYNINNDEKNLHLLICIWERPTFNVKNVEDELIPFLIKYKGIFRDEIIFHIGRDVYDITLKIEDILDGIEFKFDDIENECNMIAIEIEQ